MTHRAWFTLRLYAAQIGLSAALLSAACQPAPPSQPSAAVLGGESLQGKHRLVETQAGRQAGEPAPSAPRVPVARVIVAGDSISEGLGARRPGFSYAGLLVDNDDARYPEQTGLDMMRRYGPELDYLNIAHAGDTSNKVLTQQLPRLDAMLGTPSAAVHGRTVVFLTIGGNDLRTAIKGDAAYDGPVLDTAVKNLNQIFNYFADKARFPDGVTLYFANVYDVTDGTDSAHDCLLGFVFPGLARGTELWADAYQKLAQSWHKPTLQVHLLDALSLFRGHAFHYHDAHNPYFQAQDASLWLSDRDCIHPNHRGHHELRRAFWQLFEAQPPEPLSPAGG